MREAGVGDLLRALACENAARVAGGGGGGSYSLLRSMSIRLGRTRATASEAKPAGDEGGIWNGREWWCIGWAGRLGPPVAWTRAPLRPPTAWTGGPRAATDTDPAGNPFLSLFLAQQAAQRTMVKVQL